VGALFLVASSLLNLGLGTNQLRIGIGLLTLVSGAELIYGFIEPSLALIALLAMVHLGIVLVFSYIISIQIRYPMSENLCLFLRHQRMASAFTAAIGAGSIAAFVLLVPFDEAFHFGELMRHSTSGNFQLSSRVSG